MNKLRISNGMLCCNIYSNDKVFRKFFSFKSIQQISCKNEPDDIEIIIMLTDGRSYHLCEFNKDTKTLIGHTPDELEELFP